MTPERKARLESLPWWVWSVRAPHVLVAWNARFDELVAFYEANGTLPPHSAPGGLGKWVGKQRQRRATMTPERKARLDALGWWVWSVRAPHVLVAWNARFDELVAYHAEHGRCPRPSTPGGLGTWVQTQRTKRETMDAERKARLDALAWWVWDALDAAWSTNFDELVAYHAEHGRLPPCSTRGLGIWVDGQRQRRATMSVERKARLEALEWWAWDARDEAWSTKFDELVAYHAEHGRLPTRWTPGGLGTWVYSQRQCRATMTPERKAKLEALAWWVWNTLDDAWSTRYDELVAYRAEHGRTPPCSMPGIGNWVAMQRKARATMAPERKARLEALGWWAWNPLDEAWTTRLDELVAFYEATGRLPPVETPGGLGTWVTTQRKVRATMSAERKQRLESLGWWVWGVRDARDNA
jgi:hypothetical protein